MLLVTGGAGFIGSNVVAALNDAGRADVVVCDELGRDGKWRNLAKRQLADRILDEILALRRPRSLVVEMDEDDDPKTRQDRILSEALPPVRRQLIVE